MNRFNLAQRIIVVIGWGLALFIFGRWVTYLGQHRLGWVAYAPLSRASFVPALGGLHPWARMLAWVGLVVVWMVGAMWVLRTATNAGSDDSE